MKTTKEILTMLIHELKKHYEVIKAIKAKPQYYNSILGDTSFLLAALLDSLLSNVKEWGHSKWMDDSLLTNISIKNDNISIEGIMIWGKEDSTKQWTEPFCFEIRSDYQEFTFLFSDSYLPEISYEKFRNKRDYWNDTKHWKYIIKSNDEF